MLRPALAAALAVLAAGSVRAETLESAAARAAGFGAAARASRAAFAQSPAPGGAPCSGVSDCDAKTAKAGEALFRALDKEPAYRAWRAAAIPAISAAATAQDARAALEAQVAALRALKASPETEAAERSFKTLAAAYAASLAAAGGKAPSSLSEVFDDALDAMVEGLGEIDAAARPRYLQSRDFDAFCALAFAAR